MATSPPKTLQLSIIIVNYLTDQLILNLLVKLGGSSEIQIIIVDNSPKNTIQKKLKTSFPFVQYHFMGKNLGFANANNHGIKLAQADWILLLNSDTLTTIADLKNLLRHTQESEYLVATPRLIDKAGKVENNVGYFDSPLSSPLNWVLARPRFLNCQRALGASEVDLLTGAAMLVNKSVFDSIGLLDDLNYFMYFEDIDFSYRLFKAKIKVLYDSSVTIIHFKGASSNQNLSQKNVNYRQGLATYVKKYRGKFIQYINTNIGFFR